MSDRYRPSENQIHKRFRCQNCGIEIEVGFQESYDTCSCGGRFEESGESYPADSSEWDEERGPDGDWRQRW